MKQLTLVIILLSVLTVESQNHTLSISITNLPKQDIYLAEFYGEQNHVIDTAFPDTSGIYSFSFDSLAYHGMYRIFLNESKFFDIIYNQEDIKIETDFNNLHAGIQVINSEENTIYYDFLKMANEYRQKFELLAPLNDYYPRSDSFFHDARMKYITIQAEFIGYVNNIIDQNPDAWSTKIIRQRKPHYFDPSLNEFERREYIMNHYFDYIDFTDVSLIRSNLFTTMAIDYMSLYSNPSFTQEQLENEFIKAVDVIMYEAMENNIVYEFIVDYLVVGFERYHFDRVLDYIAETYSPEKCENEKRKSDLRTRLEKYAELSVGKKAPNFIMENVAGKKIDLSDIPSDYSLVLFWASWCPHCAQILPKIHSTYQSIDRSRFEVLAVSLDNEKLAWETSLNELQFTWINCSELKGWESEVAVNYNIYATPTMYLLDKDKKIVAKPITFSELTNELNKLGLLD